MSLKKTAVVTLVAFSMGLSPVRAGELFADSYFSKEQRQAIALITKILKKRGFDEDSISEIVSEGYIPHLQEIAPDFKARPYGFDPETGVQYPSDVRGFAENLNSCYSKLSANKYSRDLVKNDKNDDGTPRKPVETFGYCNYRFDPATGCRLSEIEGFVCRYFYHNEAGSMTCDNWGAGPSLAFDPDGGGSAKLQFEAPKTQIASVPEKKTKKKRTKSKVSVKQCNFSYVNDDYYSPHRKYLLQAKSEGYPN